MMFFFYFITFSVNGLFLVSVLLYFVVEMFLCSFVCRFVIV